MEPSKRSKEILSLGKKLVAELEKAGMDDTLSRWLAYFLAEQIKKTESASPVEKEDSEKVCVDLILRIWGERRNGPRNLRPLGNLEQAVKLLLHMAQATADPYFRNFSDGNSQWGNFGVKVHETYRNLTGLLVYLQSQPVNFVNSANWIYDHGAMLDPHEKQLIEGLRLISERTANYYGFDRGPLDLEKLPELIVEKMQNQMNALIEAFEALKRTTAVEKKSKINRK